MKDKGFTLLELLVVIVILGILATYVGTKIMGRPDEARQTQARVQIQALENALNMYRLDNSDYPSTEQGLKALVEKPVGGNVPRNWREGGYLDKPRVPKDPWNYDYGYLCPGVRNPNGFDLFSYGADGQPGGEGKDADIGNWEPETAGRN
ncbi:MAG: Type II secretion system protein G precursor [Deltaproteobacteria bacterium ADurb.BinA179]|jgi:general secretion pathway protein G|nr:type II secretion system major pseudopilin GspG [Deltaproteobacteria bacterium]MDI9541586.1 type II secretion system major pseudopilin GspG [Pseudomonadota bacterium]NLW66820.1 type II secretion system major pseudopilin GspG [Bacteriovoracaceae bacterium]OPZ29849.1 MAG: Type II secretion system protein G precursor [Deltaproteobacteria bacterium ADurb.BinA179]HRR20797.1 type II secretion system major pseudopilin GspG [Desulfomonilia bacterium]